MTRSYSRVALFLDYENFHQSLKKRSQTASNVYGFTPQLDFEAMFDVINDLYGSLNPADFIVVANFTHYDSQKGGLDRVARLINVDSFETRLTRRETQNTPGKRHVIQNYADMRLAFEIGKHASHQHADLYILCTGDKAFGAVAEGLMERGHDVLFLLPDPGNAARLIKDHFEWVAYESLPIEQNITSQYTESESESPSKNDPTDVLVNVVSRLRREFSVGVPLKIIQAMAGPSQSETLLKMGQSAGVIDLWDSPEGVSCISLQSERLFGKVQPISTRADLVERAELLFAIAQIAEEGLADPTRAGWRRELRRRYQMSNRKAKALTTQLFDLEILQEGRLEKPRLSLEQVIEFLRA